jgi:hypothetical protein
VTSQFDQWLPTQIISSLRTTQYEYLDEQGLYCKSRAKCTFLVQTTGGVAPLSLHGKCDCHTTRCHLIPLSQVPFHTTAIAGVLRGCVPLYSSPLEMVPLQGRFPLMRLFVLLAPQDLHAAN